MTTELRQCCRLRPPCRRSPRPSNPPRLPPSSRTCPTSRPAHPPGAGAAVASAARRTMINGPVFRLARRLPERVRLQHRPTNRSMCRPIHRSVRRPFFQAHLSVRRPIGRMRRRLHSSVSLRCNRRSCPWRLRLALAPTMGALAPPCPSRDVHTAPLSKPIVPMRGHVDEGLDSGGLTVARARLPDDGFTFWCAECSGTTNPVAGG